MSLYAGRIGIGVPSSINSSNATLAAGESFTGSAEDVSKYPSIVSAIKTDQAGTLYMEFSPDGTNWDSSLSFTVSATTNEVHRLSVTRQFFRVRFTNTSASDQTYFRLQSLMGGPPPITSALNGTVQADADSVLVRPTDFSVDVVQDKIVGSTSFNKFGKNPAAGTTIVPVAASGNYRTPTALTSLEVVSSSVNDTAAGTGARTMTIIGIGTNWAETTETVTLNGTNAVALANQYYRVYRWFVLTSGTYATQSASSHAGTLTLRAAGGGDTWDTIGLVDGIGKGQSQIACYTVPAGYSLYLYSFDFSVETTKAISLYLFSRANANDTTSPYGAMRVRREYDGIVGFGAISFKFPLIFAAYTDVGFMAETASGTASVSIQMDGLLVAA